MKKYMTLLFATRINIDLHDNDLCLELFSIDIRSYQDLKSTFYRLCSQYEKINI